MAVIGVGQLAVLVCMSDSDGVDARVSAIFRYLRQLQADSMRLAGAKLYLFSSAGLWKLVRCCCALN
jgi:hypothetical protein